MKTSIFIGNYTKGVQTNRRPFMIAEEAWETLNNAFIFRGRVRKKLGYSLKGRLKRCIDCPITLAATTTGDPYTITDLFADTRLALDTLNPNGELVPGTTVLVVDEQTFTDQGDGTFVVSWVITGATQANPCEITSVGSNIVTGTQVTISGVVGMTELNGNTYTVTNTSADTFTLDGIDSSAFGAYVSGGTFTTDLAQSSSINYITREIVLDFNPAIGAGANVTAEFCYYPNLPVMGLRTRERIQVNNEQTVAFDTRFSYRFTNNEWGILPSSKSITGITNANPGVVTVANHNLQTGWIVCITGVTGMTEVNDRSFYVTVLTANTFQLTGEDTTTYGVYGGGGTITYAYQWTGNNTQYFWTTNFQNPGTDLLFWATNYSGATYSDPITVYNGTYWDPFIPDITGTRTLTGAKLLLPFKERMIAAYTHETDAGPTIIEYPQRVRYSQLGNISTAASSWLEGTGQGGFIDAPTSEAIVTAGYIRDRLIFYFERSTWELVYTGNELAPFQWRKINTELGSESEFSVITFDNALLGFGNTGIHTCNSDAVVRIDDEIPSFVFDVYNDDNGASRVYGIRDYYHELVYWTYPIREQDGDTAVYANRVLVYNYRDPSWAFWKDSWTCFGYFQRANDITWGSLLSSWAATAIPWFSGADKSLFTEIVAGNQQGFVCSFNDVDTSYTAPTRYIQDITYDAASFSYIVTSPEHNLEMGDYVLLSGILGVTPDPSSTTQVYQVSQLPTVDTFTLRRAPGDQNVVAFTGTYIGGGTVQTLDYFEIKTKFFIPYWKQDQQINVNHVDFLLDNSSTGEYSLEVFANENDNINLMDPTYPSLFGDPAERAVIRGGPEEDDSFAATQRSIWHRKYLQASMATIQVGIKLDDEQMADPEIAQSDFELHGMILNVEPVSEIV